MSKLWRTEPLGKHCYIKARIGWRGLAASEYTDSGPFLIAGKHIENGRIDWNVADHISDFRYRESFEIALAEGDVILSKDGTIGRIARIDSLPGRATINGTMMLVRPEPQINYRFLYHVLNGAEFKKLIEDKVSGSSIPHIFQRDMVTLPVSFPPIAHQEKLAEVLDTLDTAIHETEAIIAKLKAVKQGLLHDLLTRGIDANGELRPPQTEAPHLYKESPLGWISKEWELSTMGSEFEIQLGKMLDSQKNAGILKPYIGNKAVQWNRIDIGEVQYVRLSKTDLLRFRLQRGDLLVCEGGEAGRAAIWNDELGECYYQKALHRLRPLHGYRPMLMLELLRYLISKDALSEYISKTSIAHLTQEKLAAVPLPTPANDEQDRIVAEIAAENLREKTEHDQLQKFRLLKAGLMDDLLTGRVRVTPLLEDAAP